MPTLRFIDARIGEGDTCTVNLRDPSGKRIPLTISIADLGAMVNAMAGIAAAMAAEQKPVPGTVIGAAQLPVLKWQTGFSNVNREPVLILTTSGDVTQTFQIPVMTARQMGQALIVEADRATPKRTNYIEGA